MTILPRQRQRLKPIVEINMTPLMDLTFMLLIVFIITVPIMDYSTDVTPPRRTTANQVMDIKDKAIVTLDKDGLCKIDGMPIAFADLPDAFRAIRDSRGPQTILLLRADGGRSIEDMVTILRCADKAALKISLMTQAE